MASSSKQAFEITDFSGGMTDDIFTGDKNRAEVLDNFIINHDRKLISRPGSVVDDTAHAFIPSGNTRIGALINYAKDDKLFVQSGPSFFYRAGSGAGAYSTLQGPSSNDVFNAGDTTNIPSFSEWNKQLFVTSDAFPTLMKIYKDENGDYQVRNAGLPPLASNPTVTAGASSTHNYVYAFVYSYTYTADTQTFQDISAVTEVALVNAAAPNSNAVSISAIPVLTNSGGMNFDTTVITVDIYRTIDNGTNFYKCGSVTNGTTTFSDSMSDTTLQTQLELYINAGTLDFAQAPAAKFIHVVGNVGFLGYTSDTDGEHPSRIQQSTPGNVNFYPKGLTLDLVEEVKGIKSVVNFPIALCKRQIFRIDGIFDAFGKNSMQPIKIHDSAGCISHLSCVEAEGKLYWFGNDGVYTTDGYTVSKISDGLNTTYQTILDAMTNKAKVYGLFDYVNRRIHWCVEANSSNLENDTILTLDLRWGISTESTFYTWSGTSFRPTAIEMFNGSLYRGDSRGFVFKHGNSISTDPKVDTNAEAVDWFEETVIWTYKSTQFNFGNSFFRKFVSRCLLQAGNIGDTTIQITAINDDNKSSRDLKPIRWRRNFVWGAESVVWRNDDCVWDASGMIDQWRRFPARGLRLSYLQIKITNGVGIVTNSDSDGLATIDPVGLTATLLSGTWPSQSAGYFVSLETDSYVRQFEVASISSDLTVLTLLDPGNFLPVAGDYKWELSGQEKGEQLYLLGYTLHWDNVDQNQGAFHSSDSGGNA